MVKESKEQNPDSEVIVGGLSRRHKLKLSSDHIKRVLVLLAIVLVVGGIVTVIVRQVRSNTQKTSAVCNQPANVGTLKSAYADIETGMVGYNQAGKYVANIQKLHNYQKDPACVYVALTYYLLIGDFTTSTTLLNDYQKISQPTINIGTTPISTASISWLQQQLATIKKQAAQAAKNDFALPVPRNTNMSNDK